MMAASHSALQLKAIATLLNGNSGAAAQRVEQNGSTFIQRKPQSQESLQMQAVTPEKPNQTGLPHQLKAGIESLSGISMDHVKVHYNSSQPAQLNAMAYAQGHDIHVAPGQERHLPHEAWHVVQQAQGRVKATMQMKAGVLVNDDVGLETEADIMGAKAMELKPAATSAVSAVPTAQFRQMAGNLSSGTGAYPIQLATITGSGGTVKTFNETTTKSVSYAIGDVAAKAGGTATGTAEWKDVLIDAGTNNAATQLHLVNMDWGGKGGSADGNIFPGSQSLNGHHKTQENKFRRLFSAPGDKAPVAMTYTCSTNGPVGNHTFPLGPAAADVPLADHTVNVRVTDDTNGGSLLNENVAAGANMKIRDPK
ncbi:DUF4157 domain-containing protein [Undibacterium sp. LX15W]|uniref:DUF4157 domain-containing protein n=2 Tax=Undibacterium flavidum TaxID=2762297 RepID=A0ABR6YF36_9BURK|nr:DUF4157 domain-containing protein [Undibacterium flavidum]